MGACLIRNTGHPQQQCIVRPAGGKQMYRTLKQFLTFQKGQDESKFGKIDPEKLGAISYDPANHTYLKIGGKVGTAFSDGNQLK